ncbi:MAG: 3-hydroxyacyl-CoA dehydrogenase NAD-binding domain-containing protein [Deltaproteobacteria bacterium]|nr:3-hydroxyacyl-CoA dehydrogenase NAD-binding domain-containing protein [Deltaproteobacteria bacterium]
MSKIFNLKVDNSGIGVITFDVAGDAMNTWTDAAFKDFDEVIGELAKTPDMKGIIFISGKPDNFFSGANLKMISDIEKAEDVRQMLDLFHGSFAKLNAFNFPAIAAIHGHCLGGGLEFALACTARIAKEGKTTLIGMPECNVGLFPGGGGTQRLPRLIGYPALEMILKGTMMPAAKAYEAGIVDRLVPADGDLLAEAKKFLREVIAGTAGLKRPVHDFSQIDAVAEMAQQGILKATKGRYIPGPMLALKSIHEGLKVSLEKGLEVEKANFAEVVLTHQAKGSINTFFIKGMTDKPKAMMTKGFQPKPLNNAAVLGFGTMGRGIAIDILRNTQIPVLVKDIPEALEPGKAFVRKILDGMAEKKRIKEPVDSIMARLTAVSEYSDAFKNVDIVIEAVFEDIKVKQQVYEELCQVIKDDCIIASNTSSIPITAMAKYVTKPERFGGVHFFSPVWLMQLVEIIKGERTSQDTIDNLLNFSAVIRKRPIVCRDNAGFVVNALLFPMVLETFRYLEEGNAIEKIDKAMLSFGMPIGPIRLTDEVGIDIPYKIFKGMGVRLETLANVVEAGRLGLKKSGKGFFLKDGNVDPEVLPLIGKREPRALTEEQIQEGLLVAMVKTGKDLLDRKVVDDVRMIDVGMIWGVGFPADKGGPMKWADLIGLSKKLFGKNFY